jgi:hypothetical protein
MTRRPDTDLEKYLGLDVNTATRELVEALAAHPAPDRVFASATGRQRLADYMMLRDIKSAGGIICGHVLVGKHCARQNWKNSHPDSCLPQVADHMRWFRLRQGIDRSPILITLEPYGINDVRKLLDWCDHIGLVPRIDAGASWWFPSSTVLVELATPDGWRRLDEAWTRAYEERRAARLAKGGPR